MNKAEIIKKAKGINKKLLLEDATPEEIAEWFVQWHSHMHANDKKSIIYTHGMFYQWDTSVWKKSNGEEIRLNISNFMRECSQRRKAGITKKLAGDVLDIVKAITLVNSEEYSMPCWLDSKKDATNCIVFPNGYINVDEVIMDENGIYSFVLHESDSNLFTTTQITTKLDLEATCPKWMKYLGEVQPNAEDRENLQMLMGYTLVRDTSKNAFFLFHGEGGTGKSVFIKVHCAMLGDQNVCAIPLCDIKEKFYGVELTEKLLNAVSESPGGEINEVKGLDEALKKITSGDKMIVQRKYAPPYTAVPSARMLFAANDKPYFSDKSNGLWDRMRVFLFDQVMRGKDGQNPYLDKEIIAEELEGVLSWALEGLVKLKRHKVFPQSARCKEFVKQYKCFCNSISIYLHERVRSSNNSIGRKELYEDYKQWCNDGNIKSVSQIKFNDVVDKELNVKHDRSFNDFGSRIHVWNGIEFKSDS